MKRTLMIAGAVVGLLGTSLSSQASFTLLGSFSGNDCSGVFGTGSDCVATYTDPNTGDVLLAPTPLIAKFDRVGETSAFGDPLLGNFTSITGAEFVLDYDSGSWTYTPGTDDPVITAFVIKQGNGFDLYGGSGTSGSWGAGNDLSHISFYDGGDDNGGGGGAVPEPATLALVGLGLLGAAVARRRQRG